MVLQQVTRKDDNCLNLIRLFAAIQVMYGHYVIHLHVNMPKWIDLVFSFFPGVPIFSLFLDT